MNTHEHHQLSRFPFRPPARLASEEQFYRLFIDIYHSLLVYLSPKACRCQITCRQGRIRHQVARPRCKLAFSFTEAMSSTQAMCPAPLPVSPSDILREDIVSLHNADTHLEQNLELKRIASFHFYISFRAALQGRQQALEVAAAMRPVI
jgi:hypothetical protein